jgi:GT2 family glycosyltransferase
MLSLQESSSPRVAIVLVNWNGWRECIECIDTVLAQSHQNFHIFVVDNDSQDQSVERIIAWCSAPEAKAEWRRLPGVARYTDQSPCNKVPHREVSNVVHPMAPTPEDCLVTLVRSGGNLGFAGGCNVAIKAAGIDEFAYFWFLNPDTVVARAALVELVARAESQSSMGIVGSTLLFYDKPNIVHTQGGGRLNRSNGTAAHIGEGSSFDLVPTDGAAVERELSWVCGASMFVSLPFIREIGPMQEDYFLYYEEADWATRGRHRFQLGYAPKSIVFHKSGANSSKIMPMFTAGFYYRSRLRFVNRFLPDRMPAAKRQLFMEMLKHLARGRWAVARLIGVTLLRTESLR